MMLSKAWKKRNDRKFILSLDQTQKPYIVAAAKRGTLDTVRRLKEMGYSVNEPNITLNTALHYASARNREDVVSFLIESGADMNARDCCGATPLHFAARQGAMEAVRLLVAHGAKTDAVDDFGYTVAEAARTSGHEDVAVFIESHQPPQKKSPGPKA